MWPTAVAVLLAVSPPDDLDRFFAEYAPHWERITTHLWRNVKVSGRVKARPYGGPLTHTVAFTAVADDTVMVRRKTVYPVGSPPEPETAAVITPDQAARILQGEDGTSWRVWRQIVPWSGYGMMQTDMYYDTLAGGALLDLPLVAPYIGWGPNAYYRPSRRSRAGETAVHRVRYDGQPVIEVWNRKPVEGGELTRMVRLRTSDWLVTSVEECGMLRQVGEEREFVPTRTIYDVSYRTPAEPEKSGLPFPEAIRCRHILPDGTELPGDEVAFHEYTRYTPHADELDPARLFGITFTGVGPRPALPPLGEYLAEPPGDGDRSDRPVPGQPATPPQAANAPFDGGRLLLGGGLAGAILFGGVAVARRRAESSRPARPSNT